MLNKTLKNIFILFLGAMMSGIGHAQDITVTYNGSKAKIKQSLKDSVTVTVNGATVNIDSRYEGHKLTLLLKGQSNDGQLIMKNQGKVKVTLSNLSLTSQEGAPFHFKNKKKVEIKAPKGTENTLTITACNDTVNHKAATIWAKGKLLFTGKGKLNIVATGDGCRGIKSKKDITIEELTLNVTTSGNNLGIKPFTMPMGDFKMPEGAFPMQGDSIKFPGPPNFPDGQPDFSKFPPMGGMHPENGDSIKSDFPDMPEGGFGGKHKYYSSTKGIASKGKVIINSGDITVRTFTAGAEGIEGKEGVIFNGGNVDIMCMDDAVNANACIEFNGANVMAYSTGNDAVDANLNNGFFPPFGENKQSDEVAIVIRGGKVFAWSQVGSPEEGIDCDFASIVIEGGTVFSVGGGMGELPSVPTNKTAKQPTAVLVGLNIVKDEPIIICDTSGKVLDTVTIPFSMKRSASLVSSPAFKSGATYTVKTQGYEKTFTFTENFTIVR